MSGLASKASHSAANRCWIWRYGRPSLPEDEAARVAERAGVALDGPGFRGGRWMRIERVSDLRAPSSTEALGSTDSAGGGRRPGTGRCGDGRRAGTAIAVAMTAWMIRLPDPGSMYASSGIFARLPITLVNRPVTSCCRTIACADDRPRLGAASVAGCRRRGANGRCPVHPLLLAAWPVLFLYGQNVGELQLAELVVPLVVVVAGRAAASWWSAAILVRDGRRAALIVSGLAVALLLYGHVADLLGPLGSASVDPAGRLGAPARGGRGRGAPDRVGDRLAGVTRGLNIVAAVLVVRQRWSRSCRPRSARVGSEHERRDHGDRRLRGAPAATSTT